MSTIVQTRAFQTPAVSPITAAFTSPIGADTMLVVQLSWVIDNPGDGIASITDLQGNAWSAAAPGFDEAGLRIETWWVPLTNGAGVDDLTITLTIDPFGGDVQVWMYEIAGMGTGPTVETSNTLPLVASADPLIVASVTTTIAGSILAAAAFFNAESSASFAAWQDSFTDAGGVSTASIGFRAGYRLTGTGIAAVPAIDFTGATVDGISMTVGFAEGVGCSDDWGVPRPDGLPYVPLLPPD